MNLISMRKIYDEFHRIFQNIIEFEDLHYSITISIVCGNKSDRISMENNEETVWINSDPDPCYVHEVGLRYMINADHKNFKLSYSFFKIDGDEIFDSYRMIFQDNERFEPLFNHVKSKIIEFEKSIGIKKQSQHSRHHYKYLTNAYIRIYFMN